MLIPVILSGGSGTRLWPLSRASHPKQFLSLVNEHSLLQNTLQRAAGIEHTAQPIVVCHEDHRFIVAEQLRQISCDNCKIILEPSARNTAPAVTLAALMSLKQYEKTEPLLIVLAADHVMKNASAFCKAVGEMMPVAKDDRLVTFGIVPTEPETGYGYIKTGGSYSDSLDNAYLVEQFCEKPDRQTAEQFVHSNDYLWNAGIFLFKASVFVEEIRKYRPDILNCCEQSIHKSVMDMDFIRPEASAFNDCSSESIDIAVMEKTDRAVVRPLPDVGWSDLGSWHSLWEASSKDSAGNSFIGDVLSLNTKNCYIRSENKLIATLGTEDLVIIECDDAILVAHKGRVQDVKQVVKSLKKNNRRVAWEHKKVFRPWGMYDSVDAGERFQVKRITVKPGGRLSLQKHHHRAEHWIVVRGTAEITRGEEKLLLTENESTYIPIGMQHRLVNAGKIDLEIIEVQSGSYLGEDDIVRIDDDYGRRMNIKKE